MIAVQSNGMGLSLNCGLCWVCKSLQLTAVEGMGLALSHSSLSLVCSTRCSCSAVWVSECWCVSGRRTAIGRREKCVCGGSVAVKGNTMINAQTRTQLCAWNPCLKWSKSSVCPTMRDALKEQCIFGSMFPAVCAKTAQLSLCNYKNKFRAFFLSYNIPIFSNDSPTKHIKLPFTWHHIF